jgi:hypothetical protein
MARPRSVQGQNRMPSKIPMRARDVLSDCKQALEDFDAAGATPYWRTRWTAVVALLRAVGHVLHKIDAPKIQS